MTFLLLFLSTLTFADEFSQLEKKQLDKFTKNPFAGRSAICVTQTPKGLTMKETWRFPSSEEYIVNLGAGVTFSGRYKVKNNSLILSQEFFYLNNKKKPSVKKETVKYKIKSPIKFQFIRGAKDKRSLYHCGWSVSL